VSRYFGALARLASSGPSEAVFLYGWPHEASGDELSRCLDNRMAEGMERFEHLTTGQSGDVRTVCTRSCVTIQLDLGAVDEELGEL
jgi:hypothetical protein